MFHSIYEILFSNYFHKVSLQNNVIKNSRNCASFTKIIIIFCHVSSNKFLKVRANNIMLSIFERKHCFLKVCHDILLLFYALNPSLIYHCCFPYQQQSSFFTLLSGLSMMCSTNYVTFDNKKDRSIPRTHCSLTFLILKQLLN
jgi:hypothetical protein